MFGRNRLIWMCRGKAVSLDIMASGSDKRDEEDKPDDEGGECDAGSQMESGESSRIHAFN